jgi:transposase
MNGADLEVKSQVLEKVTGGGRLESPRCQYSGTHNPMKRGSASVPMRIAVRTGTRPSPTLVLRARSKVWPGPCAPQPVAPVVRGARRAVCSIAHGPPVAEGKPQGGDRTREVIIPCRAGLDVHQRTVVARVRRLQPDGQIDQEVRTFGTRTADLPSLADWLVACGVTQVAMESTGVSWKPVSNLLETRFTILVVNAQHIKQVPGRKPDVNDCPWMAQLLQHGLLRASFVPPQPIRPLRDLTRQRTQLVRHRATMANRLQKVLEDANIKLASVATDILGASGRARIRALIAGEQDPARRADWARRRLRAKTDLLVLALTGQVTDHPRFQLRGLREQVERLDGGIEQLDGRILEATTPFEAELTRLMTIPGLSRRATEVLIAEVGVDLTAFPTAGHLGSWAGMSPGNHPSAGQRSSGRTTKGSPWLRSVLVQAAWSTSHTKKTRLSTTYHKLARRIGKKRAVVAVGRKILKLVYELWKGRTDDQERLAPDQAAGITRPSGAEKRRETMGILVIGSGHVPGGRDRRSWSAPEAHRRKARGRRTIPWGPEVFRAVGGIFVHKS